MSSTLHIEKLSEMIRKKRGDRGLRGVAKEIGGVSASTLSRVEQGSLPDINTFTKLCEWLNVPTDFFTKAENSPSQSYQREIVAHLRADRLLDTNTAESLIQMITLAYQQTKGDAGRTKNKR